MIGRSRSKNGGALARLRPRNPSDRWRFLAFYWRETWIKPRHDGREGWRMPMAFSSEAGTGSREENAPE
jgi:hypothetical protein